MIIDDVYENLKDCNTAKKMSVLIVSHDMIADMESNKKLNLIVTELVSGGRKLNILLALSISQSYFKVPKTIRRDATHYFIIKVPNKREFKKIASNHLSDIDFKYFMELYRDYTKEQYQFLVNDTTLSSNSTLKFRKNLL